MFIVRNFWTFKDFPFKKKWLMARNHLRLSLPFKTIFRKQNKNKNKTNNTLFLLIWHCFGMTRQKKAAKIVHCCNGKMIVFSVSEWGRRKTRWMMFFCSFLWIWDMLLCEYFFFFLLLLLCRYWRPILARLQHEWWKETQDSRNSRTDWKVVFCSNAFTRLWIICLLYKHICKQWHSNRLSYFDKWEMSKCYVLFVVYLKTDFEVCQSNAQLWRF
jgi:hypothetical protein